MVKSKITVYAALYVKCWILLRFKYINTIIIAVVGNQVLISRPEGSFSEEQFEAANEIVMLAAGTGKNIIVNWLLCVNSSHWMNSW